MAALCVILAAACCYDYRENRIPNYLVLLAAVLGAGWQSWDRGLSGVFFYLGQTVLTAAVLYPVFKIGGLGAGDVKLLGVTAGYLPFEKIPAFLFCSMLTAAVISLIKMWKEKLFGERMRCLSGYLQDVMASGRWKLYPGTDRNGKRAGICLAGPVLVSILFYLGGVY